MKIIALEKEVEGKTGVDFQPYLENEALHLWQLTQAGIVRETYFRADRKEAVLILEVEFLEEAYTLLDDFPLVKAGLITFEIIPLRPYDGFQRLFEIQGNN